MFISIDPGLYRDILNHPPFDPAAGSPEELKLKLAVGGRVTRQS